MKIEVLYFDVCPNHGPIMERLEEVLREEGVTAEIVKVNVSDHATAQAVGFLGSPTLRIDGLDIEPSARSHSHYGMMCRTYMESGRREGLPSRDLIRAAIKEALERGSCATAVEKKLNAVPRVHDPKVSFEHSTAEVDYETGSANVEQLEKVVHEAGYRVLSKS